MWYTAVMSTPGGAVAPYTSGSPPSPSGVIEPTAVSTPRSAAVHALGGVLKTMIHNGRMFVNEKDIDDAMNVVDTFVGAFVPGAELPALLTGAERAVREDVSQRIPPGGAPAPAAYAGPAIDYAKLAEAIVAVQRRQAAIETGNNTPGESG
jgi:hypothetical protein